MAIANATATCRGLSIGFANPALYQVAGGSYLSNFRDVTLPSPFTGSANNDALGVNNGLFPVTANFDMSTGLGSMVAPTLASSLCSLRAPVYAVAVTNPGAQQSVTGHPAAVQMHATDSGGAGVAYSASGLPAGLAISPTTGLISGTPTAPGTSTVTVGAVDQFTNAGSIQFSWTVVTPKPPTVSRFSLSGVPKRKAKLSFTVNAGAFAPALKSVTISLPSGLSFAKARKALSKGIVVKSGGRRLKSKAHLSHGALTLTFASAVQQAAVTIAGPAITETTGLASKARKHKKFRVSLGFKLGDASGLTTRLVSKAKL
jgi:hypothetical protein